MKICKRCARPFIARGKLCQGCFAQRGDFISKLVAGLVGLLLTGGFAVLVYYNGWQPPVVWW